MGTCRIVNTSRVLIPQGPYPALSETIQLSILDALWVSLPYVQRVFLYPDTNIPFPSIVESLKSSLTRILPFFHPFVGKLTYVPSDGNIIIDCSPDAVREGIAFIEAESDIDIYRITGEELHDMESFIQLVPDVFVTELPTAVLAVQVTKFSNGGVAIGLAKHHAVSDGKGLWMFMEAWAATCLTGQTPPKLVSEHDRSVIALPRGDEMVKDFIKKIYPDLPKIRSSKTPIQERLRLVRRTFIIDSSTIKLLKEKAILEKPSTFVALSAHILISIAKARGLNNDNTSITAFIPVDCRLHHKPPIVEGYTGNCVSPFVVPLCGSEITGLNGFVRTCATLKEAIRTATEDPLSRCKYWADIVKKSPLGSMVFIGGSPRFRAYETSFGWGKLGRVELTTMDNDGSVAMLAGKVEGTIQISIALSRQHMDKFARVFIIN